MRFILNIPNSLTMLRIVLIPAFVIALEYGRVELALYIFFAAAISDGLDGLIARHQDQQTELGTVLDPIADKFMLITSFILYARYGWVPEWLTIIVISRDLAVVAGWTAVRIQSHRSIITPSKLGKTAIFVEFVLICYILINKNFGVLPSLYWPLIWTTAALAVSSGLHYVHREMKIAAKG